MNDNERPQSFFLVFRLAQGQRFSWDDPIGGLVMDPARIVNGMPVGNWLLAIEVAQQRYHCSPTEQLLVSEVFEPNDQCAAWIMHSTYDREMEDFFDLMAQ